MLVVYYVFLTTNILITVIKYQECLLGVIYTVTHLFTKTFSCIFNLPLGVIFPSL